MRMLTLASSGSVDLMSTEHTSYIPSFRVSFTITLTNNISNYCQFEKEIFKINFASQSFKSIYILILAVY